MLQSGLFNKMLFSVIVCIWFPKLQCRHRWIFHVKCGVTNNRYPTIKVHQGQSVQPLGFYLQTSTSFFLVWWNESYFGFTRSFPFVLNNGAVLPTDHHASCPLLAGAVPGALSTVDVWHHTGSDFLWCVPIDDSQNLHREYQESVWVISCSTKKLVRNHLI